MLGNIANLQDIYRRCMASLPLTPDLEDWLAHSLGRYLDHDCITLNEAFGLVQGHGGVPWWRERAIRQRDAALRALAHSQFDECSVYAQAKVVAALSRRYATTCWPRDRKRPEMPAYYSGTAKEHLWRAFRSGAKMPVGERRLRALLGN